MALTDRLARALDLYDQLMNGESAAGPLLDSLIPRMTTPETMEYYAAVVRRRNAAAAAEAPREAADEIYTPVLEDWEGTG